MGLVLGVAEHLLKVFLADFQSVKALFVFEHTSCAAVEGGPIAGENDAPRDQLS